MQRDSLIDKTSMRNKYVSMFSVIIKLYNGEKYLPELLDSVMAQKDVFIDVLARDDGSKDKTVEILKKL